MPVTRFADEIRITNALATLLAEAQYLEIHQRRYHIDHRGKIDIYIMHPLGIRIAIECDHDFKKAEEEAKRRLEHAIVDLAIALRYDRSEFPDIPSELQLKEMAKKAKYWTKVFIPGADITDNIASKLGKTVSLTEKWLEVSIFTLIEIIDHSVNYVLREEDIKPLDFT